MTRRTDEENRRIYDDVYSQQPMYGTASAGRIEMIEQSCVPLIPKGSRVLDVGGGTDSFIKRLYNADHISGGIVIDIAEHAVDYQISIGVPAVHGVVNDLPFEDNEFDIVTAFELIEHLEPEDIDQALNELCRVSGSLVMMTICPFRCDHLGYDLHRTMHTHEWWVDKLSEFGEVSFKWYEGTPEHHMYFIKLDKGK